MDCPLFGCGRGAGHSWRCRIPLRTRVVCPRQQDQPDILRGLPWRRHCGRDRRTLTPCDGIELEFQKGGEPAQQRKGVEGEGNSPPSLSPHSLRAPFFYLHMQSNTQLQTHLPTTTLYSSLQLQHWIMPAEHCVSNCFLYQLPQLRVSTSCNYNAPSASAHPLVVSLF